MLAAPLRTIKAKMALVVVSIVAILGILILLVSVGLYRNYRILLISKAQSLLQFEKERTDKDILRLEANVRELGVIGSLLYDAARDDDFDLLGRNAVVRNFQINTLPVGGGIWFEPWTVFSDRERTAFYAHNDGAGVRFSPGHESAKYDYPTQSWYTFIRRKISSGDRDVVWTPPYFDEAGAASLMTTAGCLIHDENGKTVGMATIDWGLRDISESIAAIQPVPGSFVLFADMKNDFVLADSGSEDNENSFGQPLSSVPWFRPNAAELEYINVKGIPYYSLRTAFDNGMLLVVNIPESEIERDLTHAMVRTLLLLAGFGVLIAAVIHFMLTRFINRPVTYLMEKTRDIGKGNLDVDIALPSGDELGHLAETLGTMASNLKTRIAELKTMTAEKERIGAELDIARDIQTSMLPSVFPPFPERGEFDVYATMTPAKEVGGDFYDFYMIDDNRVAVVVADVSGKGVPAALFMVVVRTVLRNHARMKLSLSEVFDRVNDQLCENNLTDMFVTVFMGILDVTTGEFEFANAGHNPPLLFAGRETVFLSVKPGIAMGILAGFRYQTDWITLKPGDCLFLYTDGITEAENAADESFFGKERLLASVRTWRESGAGDIHTLLPLVKNAVDAFAADTPQSDDLTMLGLIHYGKRTDALREATVPAREDSLHRIATVIDETLDAAGCDAKTRSRLQLAVEEVFVNIAGYAYPDGAGEVVFTVETRSDPKRLVICFTDAGAPFNPLAKDDPDTSLPAGDRKIGGLGIYLAKKSVDTMEYEYQDGRNVLTLTKML